jgi:glycosyltransferase involved in cell wall biosynthesis
MKKILVISHVFGDRQLWKRWEMLADCFDDMNVTIVAPEVWENGTKEGYTFGASRKIEGRSYEKDRFSVELIDMRQGHFYFWISTKLPILVKKIKPDVILHIGTHTQDSLIETVIATKIFSRKTKIVAFSMRSSYLISERRNVNNWKGALVHILKQYKWKYIRKNVDTFFCHYPDAKKAFVEDGFDKPVYLHTQVGVDTDYYSFDAGQRKIIRKRFGIKDEFVFGSASRFHEEKGIFDVLDALPNEGNWKYLMLGSGTEEQENDLKNYIAKLGLEEKIILPGYITWDELPQYWSAMDCAIHVPRTTQRWMETFSLALVQAMSVGLPVIGNSSGSVPYQLGDDGIIVKEGDIKELREQIYRLMNNPIEAKKIGKLLRERAISCFGIKHLTKCFYHIVKDILDDKYDLNKVDMACFDIKESSKKSELKHEY